MSDLSYGSIWLISSRLKIMCTKSLISCVRDEQGSADMCSSTFLHNYLPSMCAPLLDMNLHEAMSTLSLSTLSKRKRHVSKGLSLAALVFRLQTRYVL